MVGYKMLNGYELCGDRYARRCVQRLVLINKQGVTNYSRTRYGIVFNAENGGVPFEYTDTFRQVLGTVENVEKFGYYQYRHNVQLSLVNFDKAQTLDALNRGEYFAALMDSNDDIWIFGFEFGLKPDPMLYQHTEVDTITLRSQNLEDTPPLKYLGSAGDFWNNFEDVIFPEGGDFNFDFNNDFNV